MVKDSLAETFFDRGWQNVDRHFRRLSQAAAEIEKNAGDGSSTKEEISEALEDLSSQVELFADHWLHFHCRIDALLREYNIPSEDPHSEEG
ncbi:hypothetical protein JW921_11420 [Candidatus Fermentibacterales bacterium]|nr:hypothetical protein [Candidatus Fermentibacterales bacterium]